MGPMTYSALESQDIEALSEEHGAPLVLAQLPEQELKSSASKWTCRHLVACRLLTTSEKPFLETFKIDHDSHCPVCKPEASIQQVNLDKINTIIQDCPCDLLKSTLLKHLQLPDSFFWTALARACRRPLANARDHPQRDRKLVEKENYVNSTTAIPGSSSSVPSSSSEFELSIPSVEDLDEDEHETLRSKPEDLTVDLVHHFLDYALGLCLVQDPDGTEEIHLRKDRLMSKARISGVEGIAAEDDGGICLTSWKPNAWEAIHPYLALVEAKREFKYVRFDEQAGHYDPVVSNGTLAQYLGEAVITWKANRHVLIQDVFLLAATSTYLRFMHFHFGSGYEEYIDAASEEEQKELVEDWGLDTCVHMRCTKWFNLASGEGRHAALCHILALLRWHEAQGQHEARGDIKIEDSY